MTALVVAVLLGLAGLFVTALGDMLSEEVRTRLDRLPHSLVRLASRRMPASMRDELLEEWQGELYEFLHGAEAMPVTRLVRGLRYAAGLLWAAPGIARSLNAETAAERRPRSGAHGTALATLTSLANNLRMVVIANCVVGLAVSVGMGAWLLTFDGVTAGQAAIAAITTYILGVSITTVIFASVLRPFMTRRD